jgi:ketosteroid isomerase-like protein
MKPVIIIALLLSLAGCATAPWEPAPTQTVESSLAILRKQLEDVHASRDVAGFGALHTDTAVFEWRGQPAPLTGRLAVENSRREAWALRREPHLSLEVSELRIHVDRAYEFGSYEESWIDAKGKQVTEFGRYVTAYARELDGRWRIARRIGFTHLIASGKPGG